jgi:hypothetical protein
LNDRPQQADEASSAGWWAILLVAAAASRFLLIPDHPWEQDEALFAAAGIDTDLASSRPHPPGFPLWIAAAKLGLAVLGDPLLGLQLLSAACSLVTLPLLALLWGRAASSTTTGRAAACLYAFLPAVWLHAPRAFSTTPALCLACAGLALWLRPGRTPLIGGCLLLAAAVLVRPPLLPVLALLVVAGLAVRGSRTADVVWALLTVVAVVVAGFLPVVVDAGGVGRFTALVLGHGAGHGGALHLAPWGLSGLGPVRAVGGPAAAAILGLLALAGARLLAVRRPALMRWWLAATAVTVLWLLLAHNRTYPRYALPLLALACGPAAVAIARVAGEARRTLAVTTVVAIASAAWTVPALTTQARSQFPPLEALHRAQAGAATGPVIVDGALSPFGDYLSLSRRSARPIMWRPLIAEGRIPHASLTGRWTYLWSDGTPSARIPAPGDPRQEYAVHCSRLERLAQGRFLTSWTSERGGLVVAPARPQMRPRGGIRLTEPVALLLQPAPPGSWLGAVLQVPEGGAEIELSGGVQGTRSMRLEGGRQVVHVALHERPRGATDRPVQVHLRQLGRAAGRVVLRRVWIDPADGRHTPASFTPEDQASGLDGLVSGGGFYGVEAVGAPPRSGRWTGRSAWLSVPVRGRRLVLALSAPRPEPARVVVTGEPPGWRHSAEIDARWQVVELPLPRRRGRVTVRLEVANPFVPAATIASSNDRRELGVMVGSLGFLPGPAGERTVIPRQQ